jgi:hypothetical protein
MNRREDISSPIWLPGILTEARTYENGALTPSPVKPTSNIYGTPLVTASRPPTS